MLYIRVRSKDLLYIAKYKNNKSAAFLLLFISRRNL